MKQVSRIVFTIMFLGFIFGIGLSLNAAEDNDATCKMSCKEVKCPVCGTKIEKDKAQFKSEYKGGIYYFATEKCKIEFDKTPEKYAKGCHFKTAYVCPMKDSEPSHKPGKCPKCGMELKQTEVPGLRLP